MGYGEYNLEFKMIKNLFKIEHYFIFGKKNSVRLKWK